MTTQLRDFAAQHNRNSECAPPASRDHSLFPIALAVLGGFFACVSVLLPEYFACGILRKNIAAFPICRFILGMILSLNTGSKLFAVSPQPYPAFFYGSPDSSTWQGRRSLPLHPSLAARAAGEDCAICAVSAVRR